MSGAADLDALALAADTAGQAPDPDAPGAQGAEDAPSPNLAAIGMAIELFREGATYLLKVKSLKVTLSDRNVQELAGVFAPVCDKYGWNLSTALDGPEWKAALIGGPLLWEAARQLSMELKARKAQPVDEPGQAQPDAEAP